MISFASARRTLSFGPFTFSCWHTVSAATSPRSGMRMIGTTSYGSTHSSFTPTFRRNSAVFFSAMTFV